MKTINITAKQGTRLVLETQFYVPYKLEGGRYALASYSAVNVKMGSDSSRLFVHSDSMNFDSYEDAKNFADKLNATNMTAIVNAMEKVLRGED